MDRIILARSARRWLESIVTALIVAGLSTPTAHADQKRKPPLQFAFHVDVLKDGADVEAEKGATNTAPQALSLVGIPLTFGTRQTSLEYGPGLAAGIYADYEALLSDRTTFTARAAFSKTKYLTAGWGTDEARLAGTWRYKDDDMELTLEPNWRVTMVESEVIGSKYGTTIRLKNSLADGLSMVSTARYDLYDTLTLRDDRSEAGISAGLSYRMKSRASLNVTFDAVYTLSQEGGRTVGGIDDLRNVASNMGPTISMALPISDEIEFAAAYRFCRSTDELPRFSGDEQRVDDQQHLHVSATWHNLDSRLKDFDITAAYAYDRLDTTSSAPETNAHAFTMALAVNF